MISRRRLAAVTVVVLSAAVLIALRQATPASSAYAPPCDVVGAPGPGMESATGAVQVTELRPRDRALARAYAAVGLAADGSPSQLASLDDEAKQRVDEARSLLEITPRATRTPAAAARDATAPHDIDAPSGGAPSAPAVVAESSAGVGSIVAPPSAGTGMPPAPEAKPRAVFDFSTAVDPARALHDGPDGPVLQLPGLWAKVAFLPWHRSRLVIADRSGGGYAVAFNGGDFSTLRLDGGLVVPGRFYQVRGNAVITGATPASIDIRPLDAVPSYHPRPLVLPDGNG